MKFRQINNLEVSLQIEGKTVPLGKLAWSRTNRRAAFTYFPQFIEQYRFNISPVMPSGLKKTLDMQIAPPSPFDGLHGVFNDSLPDGWGRLLLDRRLQKVGIDHTSLTPLDRLSVIGKNGMGSLVYVPMLDDGQPQDHDLDWFVEQIVEVQDHKATADIDTLQAAQGGSAGARPKLMIGLNKELDSFVIDYGQPIPSNHEQWIVKFRSQADRSDIGIEEHAYALMAKAAGLTMADTHVISTSKGNHLFATKRFDRTNTGRLHMHTASGLLNVDHRYPHIDYQTLHQLTWNLTKESSEVARMFGHMAFNSYAHNRDDHSKNHAFLMGVDGKWQLSPAYDLTYSDGPGGEHSLAIGGEGRNPTEKHLLAVAKKASIPLTVADTIIQQVRNAVERWPEFADQAGLSKERSKELDKALNPNTKPRKGNSKVAEIAAQKISELRTLNRASSPSLKK